MLDPCPFRTVLRKQLLCHRIPEADRPLNNLREEADKQCRLPEALLCLHISVTDINQVPHRLEGIKGNPDRNQKR